MTVKHLQQIQRQQLATAVATDPAVIMRFKNGFDECAAEVSRYIGRLEGVDTGVKQRLTAHLHRCVNSLHQISTFPHQNMFSTLTQNCDKNAIVLPSVSALPGDVNNNSNQTSERIQIPTGLQLIPSRLPTGELALLVPNSSQMSTFLNPTNSNTFQFHPSTNISPNFTSTLNTSPNHASAFTAVTKIQDLASPTEPKNKEIYLDNENFRRNAYVPQSFEAESKDKDNFKKINLLQINNEMSQKYQYGKLKNFMQKAVPDSVAKVSSTKPHISSTFQRNAADSTTSFTQKDSENLENNFKPFQVQLPNTHLKAHISFPDSMEDVKLTSPVQIHQKPNPNFTLNPNKLNQKSPHKFVRTYPNLDSDNFNNDYNKYEMNFEKFSKIEPLSIITSSDKLPESNDYPVKEEVTTNMEYLVPLIKRPRSTETFQNFENTLNRNGHLFTINPSPTLQKRPLSTDTTETVSPTSSESPNKIPRISLNVTLTDDYSKENNIDQGKDRCQRISVIVEDVSKNNRENNEVAVSNQRDNMWRPW